MKIIHYPDRLWQRAWYAIKGWYWAVFGDGQFHIVPTRMGVVTRFLHCLVHLHRRADYRDDTGKRWAIGCADCGLGQQGASVEFYYKPTGGTISHIHVRDRTVDQ